MHFSKTDNLSDYFAALDERLDEILPARTSVLAYIAGYTVRLVVPDFEDTRYVVRDMFARPDNGAAVDATFIWWEDCIDPYRLDQFVHLKNYEQLGRLVFKASDDEGYLEIVDDELKGADYRNNKYYLLTYPSSDCQKWPVTVHPFVNHVFMWAQSHNLLVLHAASVGIDGHGVLIVGHGGAGKSTLACSCLAEGYDFISDDYCLLSNAGSRIAYPVYTNVFLNPDSLAKLPVLKPFEIQPMQGEKPSFEVGENRIKPSLPVEAIILPQITDNAEPELTMDTSNKALAQVIYSTNKQLGYFYDPVFVRKMAQRLAGMPVYRFSLTKDLHKNCAYFKQWIKENLPCIN